MQRILQSVSVLLLALPGLLAADAIDDYLAREMALRKIPGLGLAVARDGEIARLSSYGLANVETGTPVTAESIFAIASLDKQITATALVKAAELGKLGLDDPVSQWVDIDLSGATLRQLLSHLSGLPDDTVPSFEGRFLTDYTSEQLLRQAQGLVAVAEVAAAADQGRQRGSGALALQRHLDRAQHHLDPLRAQQLRGQEGAHAVAVELAAVAAEILAQQGDEIARPARFHGLLQRPDGGPDPRLRRFPGAGRQQGRETQCEQPWHPLVRHGGLCSNRSSHAPARCCRGPWSRRSPGRREGKPNECGQALAPELP